jgi:hypothetical protein
MIEQHTSSEAESEDFADELSDEALDRIGGDLRATVTPSSGASHRPCACC